MKGLLLKDFYTLLKQMKMFLLVIVVLSFIPGYSMSSFAIVYTAMLPITALAYDERSKWNTLAATMPYSAKNMVMSKYILGYIMVLGTAVLAFTAQIVISVIQKTPIQSEGLVSIFFLVCVALIIQAVNLPFMFKMGVEKGRLVFFILVGVLVFGMMALGDSLPTILSTLSADLSLIIMDAVVVTFIVNIISVAAAVRIYKGKEV